MSALIGSKGASRELIRRCLQGDYQPLMGNALFSEYESLIHRREIITKCPLSPEEIQTLLASFMSVSQWIHIYSLWRPNLKDEADNHLIELAVAGNAQIIATKNTKDFQNYYFQTYRFSNQNKLSGVTHGNLNHSPTR